MRHRPPLLAYTPLIFEVVLLQSLRILGYRSNPEAHIRCIHRGMLRMQEGRPPRRASPGTFCLLHSPVRQGGELPHGCPPTAALRSSSVGHWDLQRFRPRRARLLADFEPDYVDWSGAQECKRGWQHAVVLHGHQFCCNRLNLRDFN